jgi:hypothetical protein
MIRSLHLSAAPTFALMALVTGAFDSGGSNALCSADGFALSGMTPMYLLMAVFHAAPWLKLMSRRTHVTLFAGLNRCSGIETMEQKP